MEFDPSPGSVTQLIRDSVAGDTAARDRLIEAIYSDLREIARRMMSRERPGHTLQATALVNEVLLRFLARDDPFAVENRNQLMAISAISMRRLLVDHARTRSRAKRGGGVEEIPIVTEMDGAWNSDEKLLLIHDALDRLKRQGERQAQVAELKIFGGYSAEEIAVVVGVTARTAERDWAFARAWLQAQLK
jgi:RNA polymerase sigma factor (TIGR02999 family)